VACAINLSGAIAVPTTGQGSTILGITFAVHRVMLWHEHGTDIDQAMLSLSTYMGHAKISNTYWYMTAVPELMAIAAGKFELFAQASEVEHD
jgi:hypothetical protein